MTRYLANGASLLTRLNSGSDIGPFPRINFIEGTGVTITVVSDPTDGEADVTISSSGGVGGSGTANKVAKFTASTTLGNSTITDDGTNVTITGRFNIGGTTSSFPALEHLGSGQMFVRLADSSDYTTLNALSYAARTSTGIYMVISASPAFSQVGVTMGSPGGSQDIQILREGAGALGYSNGTSACAFNIYNTKTSSTVYERLSLNWTSNAAFISTQAGGGGGTARELVVGQTIESTRLRSDLAVPASPALSDGDWWVECVGTSPSRICAIKVRDAGSTRTIASLTY